MMANLSSYVKASGVREKAFNSCYENRADEMEALVQAELDEGSAIGIGGTPGVILLDTQTGMVSVVPGAVPYDMLQGYINDLKAGVDTNASLSAEEGGDQLAQAQELAKNVPYPA